MPEFDYGWEPTPVIGQQPPIPVQPDPKDWWNPLDWFKDETINPDEGFEDEAWDILEGELEEFRDWVLQIAEDAAETPDIPGIKLLREYYGEAWTNPLFHLDHDTPVGPSLGEIASAPLQLIGHWLDQAEDTPFIGKVAQWDKYADIAENGAQIVESPEFGEGVIGLLISRSILTGIQRRTHFPRKAPGDRDNKRIENARRNQKIKNIGAIGIQAGLLLTGSVLPHGLDLARGIQSARQGRIPGLEDAIAEAEQRAAEAEERAANAQKELLEQLDLGGLGNGTIYGPFTREKGSFVQQVRGKVDTGGTVAVWVKEKIQQGKVIHALMGAEAQRTHDMITWMKEGT